MKLRTSARTAFVACTVVFVALVIVLLTHKSDNPVILGRYSLSLAWMVATVVVFYGAVVYVYRYGWSRLGQAYVVVATNLLSFVIVLVGINLAAHFVTYVKGASQVTNAADPNARTPEQDRVHAQLIGLDQNEYVAFRTEQGRPRYFQYEPWVGFKETPREGRYINVSPDGYRRTQGTPAMPDHWVFLLGGSTTFGIGVADSQTIATYLQARLSKTYGESAFGVRNFGRAYYYSSQEYVLLWTLLQQGVRPDVVVFFDGMNEGQTSPYYVDEMRSVFERSQDETANAVPVGELFRDMAVETPIYPYLRSLYLRRLYNEQSREVRTVDRMKAGTTARDIHRQYEQNNAATRILCEQYHIDSLFVVQPIPGYRNDYKTHVFLKDPVNPFMTEVVTLLDSSTADKPDRISLTPLLAGYKKQPFVDRLHYSPEVNRMIAEGIADHAATVLGRVAKSPKLRD
jgi:hypothetical protein